MTTPKITVRKPPKPRTKNDPLKDLPGLFRRRADLDARMAELKAEMDEVNAELLELVKRDPDGKAVFIDEDGVEHRATLVQSATTSYDEEELEASLTASQWNSVTYRTLDVKRLQDAIESGKISADTVMAARVVKERKPYVRVSRAVPKMGD